MKCNRWCRPRCTFRRCTEPAPLWTTFHAKADDLCYRPFLDDNGRLRWRENNDGRVDILDTEPDTTFYLRLKTNLGRALPVRSQL